jgi:hypothetical protein
MTGVFALVKPFHPSLMFAGKTGAYPCEAPLLSINANIKLCWKNLPGTNTLAYYRHSKITSVKSFITLGPGRGGRHYGAGIHGSALFRRQVDSHQRGGPASQFSPTIQERFHLRKILLTFYLNYLITCPFQTQSYDHLTTVVLGGVP